MQIQTSIISLLYLWILLTNIIIFDAGSKKLRANEIDFVLFPLSFSWPNKCVSCLPCICISHPLIMGSLDYYNIVAVLLNRSKYQRENLHTSWYIPRFPSIIKIPTYCLAIPHTTQLNLDKLLNYCMQYIILNKSIGKCASIAGAELLY